MWPHRSAKLSPQRIHYQSAAANALPTRKMRTLHKIHIEIGWFVTGSDCVAPPDAPDPAAAPEKLHIFPWQVFPDMAVFDWFIRLQVTNSMLLVYPSSLFSGYTLL